MGCSAESRQRAIKPSCWLTTYVLSIAYCTAQANRETINDKEGTKLLQDENVEQTNTEWDSYTVFASREVGLLRFCVDYRKLKAMTVRDVYTLPRMDTYMDFHVESRTISSLENRSE